MIKIEQILKNISFNWIAMAVGIVLGFIQAPIVVKGLGNNWYGIWVLVNQITAYTWLFDLGIREAVVRYVSRHRPRGEFEEINEIVSTAIYLYLIISLLTMAFVSIAVLLLPHIFTINESIIPIARAALFLTGLNIAFNWFFNPYIGILMGLQRFDIFQKISIVMSIVSFVVIVTVVKEGYGIIALSLVGLCGSMVSNGLIYWQCRKLLPEFRLLRLTKEKTRFKMLMNYGKYVLLNNVGGKIIFGADAIIIGIFLPVAAITFYAIPGMLINILRNLVSSVTWVLNPLFSELESGNDMAGIRSILFKATKFSFLVGLPVGIVYLIMGKTFISLWMGNEYGEGSAQVLSILALATLFSLLQFVINSVLYGLSRHHIIAWLRMAEAVVKIALCIYFIRIWGIVGVALGTGLADILFMGMILPLITCKSIGVSAFAYLKESIIPPVLASIPFGVSCYFVDRYLSANNLFTFFASIGFIMPVFLVSAWYVAFTKDEKKEYVEKIFTYIPYLRLLAKKSNIDG